MLDFSNSYEVLLKSVDCKPSRYLHKYILKIYKSGTYVFLAASGTTTDSAEREKASIDGSVAIQQLQVLQ
jgi:hypothetical protein